MLSSVKILFLITFLFITACKPNRRPGNHNPNKDYPNSIIVGKVDWVSISKLDSKSKEYLNSRSVGKLSIPYGGYRCTAFLISEDIAMTNEHCIMNKRHAKKAYIIFNYLDTVPARKWKKYYIKEFIGANYGLDYALVRLEKKPGKLLGYLKLTRLTPRAKGPIYIVHQNCDYYRKDCLPFKIISRDKLRKKRGVDWYYQADTLGGSSGAPVISSKTHRVVAIHHNGYGDRNGDGRGRENSGVSMLEIVNDIKGRFPQIWTEIINPSDSPRPPKPPQTDCEK